MQAGFFMPRRNVIHNLLTFCFFPRKMVYTICAKNSTRKGVMIYA